MSGQGPTIEDKRKFHIMQALRKVVASGERPGVKPKQKLKDACDVAQQVLTAMEGGLI